MNVKLFFAWYDFWVGFYWDRDKRALYIAPLPCVVFKFERRAELQRGFCRCGHSREKHSKAGCLVPGSFGWYCPCMKTAEDIPTAIPSRGILHDIEAGR